MRAAYPYAAGFGRPMGIRSDLRGTLRAGVIAGDVTKSMRTFGLGTDAARTLRAGVIAGDMAKSMRTFGLGTDAARTLRAGVIAADVFSSIRFAGNTTTFSAFGTAGLELGDEFLDGVAEVETAAWLSWVLAQPPLDQANLLILFLHAVAQATRLMASLTGEPLPEEFVAAADAAFALVALQLGMLYMRYGGK